MIDNASRDIERPKYGDSALDASFGAVPFREYPFDVCADRVVLSAAVELRVRRGESQNLLRHWYAGSLSVVLRIADLVSVAVL